MTDHTEKDLKIPNGLDEYIKKSLEDQENANDFNNCWSLKSMFAVGNDEAIKILPTLDEFLSAMAADPEKELFVRKVCSYIFSHIEFIKCFHQFSVTKYETTNLQIFFVKPILLIHSYVL